jgi:ABC-type phosphate transport system substrate-binding protein
MKFFKYLLLVCFVFTSSFSFAEIAVIIHPDNAASLDKSSIQKIFLGKKKSFSTGEKAIPLNNNNESILTVFNKEIVKKNKKQLKAYWSKLVFTGKGTPPQEADSDSEVIELISNNPNLIGYIDASNVNDSVKVIYFF